jgi:Flp pilus assembly protein TadD
VVAFLAQRHGRAVCSRWTRNAGVESRLANVPVAYARYLARTFWPADLAVLYPYRGHWPEWAVGGSGVLLALVTMWAMWRVRAQPWLAVGWFWFLGMLVPVIGLVQIGWQSMADRYDYLPSVGLFIMIIWAAKEWIPRSATHAPAALGGLAVAGCLAATRMQVGYWTNSETLFRHAVETTEGNGVMESSLGRALFLEGRKEEAMPHLARGVALDSRNPGTYYNLGNALLALGRVGQAVEQFQIAVNLAPRDAINQFTLGAALLQNGRVEDAIRHLETALQIFPNDADSHDKLGTAYMQAGRAKEAAGEFEKALQIEPDHLPASASLAWMLASNPDGSLRNGTRAVGLALRADRLSGGQNPVILATLGAAYAEAGMFSEAVAAAQRALPLAAQESQAPLAATLQAQLALYRTGFPFRDTNPAGLPSALMDK